LSVQFLGDGVNTSSISFNTLLLTNNPIISSDIDIIEQNLEVIESDAGYRTVYQKGERQKPSKLRFSLLTETDRELLREWIESVKGGSNWFTLQDQNIGIKTAISVQTGSTSSVLKNASDLSSANWPVKPIGQWVIFTSGALIGKRRRIMNYLTGFVSVDPAFSTAPAVDDTFIVGLPVFLLNNPVFSRIGTTFWQTEFEFPEVGGYN